ncbi:hypothetical protein OBV_03500 [Oscillibacter valericigenes Sjm18-20]|nr:hypothetical protein OBV_03500 [Oscillibacter valericigenes Sjm18-20]
MKKEYSWMVEIAGANHTILCQLEENTYNLWADDEHIKTVYRKIFQRTRGGIDEAIAVFGACCNFAVWENEIPDLYLNGVSLTDGRAYESAIKKHDKMKKRILWITFMISALAIVSYGVLTACGVNTTSLTGFFVLALFYAVASFVSMRAYKK